MSREEMTSKFGGGNGGGFFTGDSLTATVFIVRFRTPFGLVAKLCRAGFSFVLVGYTNAPPSQSCRAGTFSTAESFPAVSLSIFRLLVSSLVMRNSGTPMERARLFWV